MKIRQRIRAARLAFAAAGTSHTPKMMIETLSIAQSRIGASELDRHRRERDIARIQFLINWFQEFNRD